MQRSSIHLLCISQRHSGWKQKSKIWTDFHWSDVHCSCFLAKVSLFLFLLSFSSVFFKAIQPFSMSPQILKKLYSCTIESITAWYGNRSVSDRKALQRVVRMAQYIPGAKLPAIQDLYTKQCQRKAHKIVRDSSHPSHRLFSLLPHGKRYRSTKYRSKRLK